MLMRSTYASHRTSGQEDRSQAHHDYLQRCRAFKVYILSVKHDVITHDFELCSSSADSKLIKGDLC